MKNIFVSLGYHFVILLVFGITFSTKSDGQIITTVAGNGSVGFSGDGGAATAASLSVPCGVTADDSGNVFIADLIQHRVRKVNVHGIISTIAGNGSPGYSGDGGMATAASLNSPFMVALDKVGNLYISDHNNSCIRKVDTSGIISTVAGNGSFGYSGDGGMATAAKIGYPIAIAVDTLGNIYMTDYYHSVVREVSNSGIINTIAGTGTPSYSGDGGAATAATLSRPIGIAVDMWGNIYIADDGILRVRRISPSGIINAFAGNGSYGFSGDGGAATSASLSGAVGVCTDRNGNVFIANDYVIRSVNPAGIIYTTAGIDTPGFSGDGGQATSAKIRQIQSIYINSAGNLYIDDAENYRIRKISCSLNAGTITGIDSVCPSSTVTLTDTSTGGTWVSSNPVIATVNPTSGVVTGLTAGSAILSYSVANSCGTSSATHTITINPLPDAGTISGTDSVCAGSSILFTDTSGGGMWSSSNAIIASIDSSSGIIAGLAAGSAVIRYNVANTCGSDTANRTIVVRPLPNAGTISGSSVICPGNMATLSSTVTGGIWSSSSGSIASVNHITGVVVGIATGRVTIDYVVTNSCGTDTVTHSVTINPLPNASIISGTDSVCPTATITLTDTATGGTWLSSNSSIASVNPTTGAVTGITFGSAAIMYVATNTCGSDTARYPFTVRSHASCTAGVSSPNLSKGGELVLYPNPNQGSFTISLSSPTTEQPFITITNILGQKVKEFTIGTNKETEVKLNVPAGVYLIATTVNGERVTGKIVVE